jgi:uncharacterized membrane protein YeaQ/YmgE (transglycosylase-associated protein family)
MGIILWLIFGALAGWLASKIVGTDAQQGWIMNIVMGIIGAFVGGFIWSLISSDDGIADFSIGGLILAILGAVIVSFAIGALTGKRTV